MIKKSHIAIFVGVLLTSTTIFTGVQAAPLINNGVPCSKAGATKLVKVKGISKTYICHTNPATPSVNAISWTLKTCISYYTAAQGQQNSINEQLPLIAMMSEPDKTTYTTALNQSQVKLNAVIATIKANYCKAGL
jgi:hypothetical protein